MSISRRLLLGSVAATVVSLGAEPRTAEAATSAAGDKADDGWTVLEARPGSAHLTSTAETAVWGYGGTAPGPLLRLKKGAELKVRLVNRLAQPTSLCWHGVRGPNAMDGVAGLTQKAVQPGESFDYRFTPPDSGLFWYHPHAWPTTAEQMDHGLYGALIVDEVDPPFVDREVLVVIADWTLDAKGQVDVKSAADAKAGRTGRPGSLLSVNAATAPATETVRPGSRVRLRVVSAVGARIMIVTFEGVRPMVQAIDGQPCELFEPVRQTIPIGPGARFDIMLDLPPEASKVARLVLRGEGEPDRPLLILKTDGEPLKPHPPIAALPANAALPGQIHLERAFKMNLVIDGAQPQPPNAPVPAFAWTLNGVGSDGFSGKPLFTVKRGAAVSLALVNKSASAQQIHIHGHVVRLLHDLDDGWEPYWRDSVLVAEGRTKHVAFVADNPGKWTLESLMLDRQVGGLAAWFEVT